MDGDSAAPTAARLAEGCGWWPLLSSSEPVRDCGDLLWASVGDDFDLRLLAIAEAAPENNVKIRVAVAHVDGFGKNGSAIDKDTLTFDLFDW